MTLQQICPCFPDFVISLSLFKNVKNAKKVRQLVMANTLCATLLKPSLVLEPFQVLVAANKAIHQSRSGKMVTRTLHSEVLYCLSASKNISDTFKRFGSGDHDTSVLVVEVCEAGKSNTVNICAAIDGDQCDLGTLKDVTDETEIKKVYKIKDLDLTVGSLLDAVVGRIASKDFVTF